MTSNGLAVLSHILPVVICCFGARRSDLEPIGGQFESCLILVIPRTRCSLHLVQHALSRTKPIHCALSPQSIDMGYKQQQLYKETQPANEIAWYGQPFQPNEDALMQTNGIREEKKLAETA